MFKKDINKEADKTIKILIYTMRNDMLKVEGKHLIFKTSITGIKICLLMNNKSEAKFVNKSFVYINQIPFFELKKLINFIFRNNKVVQQFIKKALIEIIIGNYIKQVVYYLANQMYTQLSQAIDSCRCTTQ